METPAATMALEAGSPTARRWWSLLRKSIGAHAIFLAIAVGYLLVYKAADALVPAMAAKSGIEVVAGILFFSIPMALFALLIFKFVELAVYEKPDRALPALWRNFSAVLKDRRAMANGLPMFAALVIFMYVFTMVKANISVLQPFAWDQTFDDWDRILHFGYRPWELLQPIVGYLPVTLVLNFNYNFWFVVMNLFWVYYAFLREPGAERTRYYLAFMAIWIVGGGVMAVLLSSAGPCFFSRLGLSPDPYAGLMAYLNQANEQVPIWAVGTQAMLWDYRLEGSAFGGVSAMPSMHNATALLFVLASAGKPPWVRRLLIVHAVLIFVGSIHLGWHYASDAYVAWALTLALWWAAGHAARWWHEGEAQRAFDQAFAAER